MSVGAADIVSRFVPSPNHGERAGGRRPDMLLLHYTGMSSAEAALRRLCDPEAAVSAHYLVGEDGSVTQLVPEDRRAWHAGAGAWAGETDINTCSIGIEVVNPGHDGGLPPYPEVQIGAVITLADAIVRDWGIPADRVLAHSDVAPSRKEDPGELFPWDRLAEAGIGLWVDAPPPDDDHLLASGGSGEGVEALQDALAEFGYGIETTGVFDAATVSVLTAFQRHFRPARVDGILDRSTLATLQHLLERRPAGIAEGA
ncbi:MAG: N-acetylmuramoyl-L-alanine amidase [Enterovirga sp.]|nr:N-acetylmuramoyl-L-alanine amidase [Enterovirga sp.]